ncbi:sensor histidine kinase [Fibrella aquatica]|uniref:sensor histidine kinase n=1 Tax=Fibrella aquatica TaxID=3242487 RepID=UPI003522FEEC
MSLRSRIVIAVATVFASISLLAGLLLLNRAENSLERAFDRAVQTRAEWLLSMVNVDPVVIPLPIDQERMLVVYQTYDQSRQLFKSPGFPNTTAPRRNRLPVQYTYRAITIQSTSDQFSDGQLTLKLAVPDASLRQDIEQLRWMAGLGWLLSLLIAFGTGYLAAGWLLRPLNAIIDQANDISNATESQRITLPASRDELYQLTDTLNQMLERIWETTELQRNFFGAAAHELRTPLAIMKTGLEVTLNSNEVDHLIKPFLTSQLDDVSRLARLLDEFLALSRPESSARSLNVTDVNLAGLLRQCVDQLTVLTLDYEVTIQLILGEDADLPVLTDAVKLEHILLNLIENAIKYAVTGSTITVQTMYLIQHTISVQNQTARESGPTLDLLQPYFRADPLKEGHGLGLWISHRLTMLLNGQLSLNWQAYTFTSELTLPANNH